MTSSLRVSPSAGPPAGDRFGWIIFGGLGSISSVIGVTMLFQAGDAEGLIAGAVFTVAGIGMIAAGVWIRRVSLERHTLQQRDPARPWRWRRDWVAGRIESDARRDSIVLWSVTLLWNLMSLPVWFGMAGAAIFFAWIFPAIGLVLLSIAIRESLRAQRYGRSTFVMHSVPGVLGGHLRGEVHVATSIGAAHDLTARLFCHWPVSKARPAHSWQEELPVERARALAGVTGSVLPVAFTIPYGLPASDKHGEVVWYLEVAGQAVGVDYFARFEVPVFETPDSSPEIDVRSAAPPPAELPALGDHPVRVTEGSRIRIARHDSSLEIGFPALRNPRASAILSGVWLLWSFITLLFMSVADGLGPVATLLIFGVGAFLSGALLDSVFGSVRLRVRQGRLERSYRWLGIGWTRVWQGDQIGGFEIEFRGRSRRTDLYDLRAERPGRRPRTLARAIRGKRLAEALRNWVEQAYGAL